MSAQDQESVIEDYSNSSSEEDEQELETKQNELVGNIKSILKKEGQKPKKGTKIVRKEVKLIGAGEDNKLTMNDFLRSIEGAQSKQDTTKGEKISNEAGISSAALKKQLNKISKEIASGAPALQAPMSGVKKQRLERKANYETNKKKSAKWLNQVKKNRESDYVDFTIEENRTKGATLASMATEFTPKDDLEKQIQDALVKDGIATEKDIMEKEKKNLLELDPEELKRRMKHMHKLKNLLFRQELKNKRLAKIKSKLYHKIKRKAKEKEEGKLLEELELIDPEAAKEYRDKIEEKRVEERISLRHGTTSKFAKNLKRYGKFTSDANKDAYFDLMRQRDELSKKTKNVNTYKDGEEESDISSDEANDTLDKLKKEALQNIDQNISDSESEESNSDEEGFDEDKIARKKAKQDQKKNKKTGILGMKFMQKAEAVQKEILKQKSKALIDEINQLSEAEGEDDEDDDMEDEDTTNIKQKQGSSKQKFKGENEETAMRADINLETEDVQELVSDMNKKKSKKSKSKESKKDHIDKAIEDAEVPTANDLVEQWQESVNKVAGKKRNNKQLTFNQETDLKDFKIDEIKNRKRIKFEDIDDEDEEKRKFYVTNEDLEKEEFEKQKQTLIEEQMEEELGDEDKKKEKPMDGWGSWTGEGITKSRAEINKEKKRRERKIKEIKDKRRDNKKANVIINESRDKKFTKYMVSELPHPFKSAGQFEQLMNVPVGKEWNTLASYKRLIQPEVLLKAGKIIKPLKFKKDISLKAVEALVQNRKDPSRPAAKF